MITTKKKKKSRKPWVYTILMIINPKKNEGYINRVHK